MFPNVNPKQMKKMMKQMGMSMDELDAIEVIIKMEGREIVIENPSVTVIKAQGQKNYQITGTEVERLSIPKEDIQMVMSQAGVSEEEAVKALKDTEGDLAEAIMKLAGGE